MTKNFLLGIFRLQIGKNDCDIWNQQPRILQYAKNMCNTKKKEMLDQNLLIWLFWAVSLKSIVIFEISIFEFVNMQSFVQN